MKRGLTNMRFVFMKKMLFLVVIMFLPIYIGSCALPSVVSETTVESTADFLTNYDRYMVHDPLYRIEEVALGKYRYSIGTKLKVYAEGIKEGTEPEISYVGNGIIRLFLGYGTNCFTVQYFDVWNDRTSETFSVYSNYADICFSPSSSECLLATFDFPRNVLVIRDIFDPQGFYAEIDRDFVYAGAYQLLLLNETDLYVDADVFEAGYSAKQLSAGERVETRRIREIISFRSNSKDALPSPTTD